LKFENFKFSKIKKECLSLKKRIIIISIISMCIIICITINSFAYIKWVNFSPSNAAMTDAMNYDIKTYKTDNHMDWIDILAYLGVKYGGDFSRYKKSDLTTLTSRIENGETISDITKNMKNFDYFKESYSAVLSEYLGEYAFEENGKYNIKYGLKVFSPIAEGYSFAHYDDYGNSRSFGYKRKHLGHDLMGNVGTPVIAIEGGVVEAVGWNMYGGWRIGIRSHDTKRYYYYAHLRKNHPYAKDFSEGDIVNAGDVIGYIGMTGYSRKENVNNIDTPHLHFGIQLIFDESQKDGINQIWIDLYQLTLFLQKNRQSVHREGNEFVRNKKIIDTGLINGD